MSIFEKDSILDEIFSSAGKASAEKYNVFKLQNKLRKTRKQTNNNDNVIPDLSWGEDDSNKDPKIYSFEDFSKVQAPNQKNKVIKEIKRFFKENVVNNNKNKKSTLSDSMIARSTFYKINSPMIKNKNYLSINPKSKLIKTFNIKGIKPPLSGVRYKYHNLHMKRLLNKPKTNRNKNESVYNPKLDIIYNRVKIGPIWKKISGRKFLVKQSANSNERYYDNVDTSNHGSFIDLGKQTQRNGFPINHNLRNRYESKYIPVDNKDLDIKWKKINKRPLKSKSPFSRDQYNYKILMVLNHNKDKKFYTNYKPSQDKFLSNRKGKYIPDFNRCLSREYLEKLERKKLIEPIELIFPRYNSVKERSKNMVDYDIKSHKNINYIFKGVDSNELFNLTKSFESLYGNKLKVVPNFEKMLARPEDKTLPSFMKQLYNRMSSEVITDNTLKLNNYSNRVMCYDTNTKKQNKKKIKKQKDSENSLNDFIFLLDENIQNENETNEANKSNSNTLKLKKDIDNIIRNMNKLYDECRNKGKY